jgi:lycopene cyclase domain-containing protein
MLTVEFLRHFAYLAMEAVIIGGVAFVLWAFHLRFLWARRWRILLGLVLVSVYTLPMDALAVSLGWGGFNPAYVSGIYFLDGVLLLEEIIFWSGTSFVTLSAVLIFAELERQGVPWWALPLGVVIPLKWIISAFSPTSKKATKSEV